MRVLVCSSDVSPCPDSFQSWVNVADMVDPAVLGVTPSQILQVFGWGVASVIFFWSIGFAVGVAVKLIRKI